MLVIASAYWPTAGDEPVAWKLVVRSTAGELVSAQSFLWSKPAAK